MAMLKLGEKIVSARVVILILGFILLIPAAYGYIKTKVNYDILSYLPKDIETMVGQDILVDQFGTGAFSLYVVEGMEDKEVSALKSKIALWMLLRRYERYRISSAFFLVCQRLL